MWWPKSGLAWLRFDLIGAIIIVVAVGVGSRLLPVGSRLFDKYVGDALYAVLFYLLLCLVWPGGTATSKAWLIMAAMVVIESFQLTGIPLQLRLSGDPLLKIVSIVLGTAFSWLDIAAYLVGILGVWALDVCVFRFSTPPEAL